MVATDMATASQSLLALYGALDQAVTNTGNPEIEAVVERYLPGSTGVNAGWYEELLGFLASLDHREVGAPAVPDLGLALTTLQTGDGSATDAQSQPLTAVQMSRLVFAIGALSHLPQYYPPDRWDEQFAATLTGVGAAHGSDLLSLLRRAFHERSDWPDVMHIAVSAGLIRTDVAAVPLCQAKPKIVRGRLCVVYNTQFTSTAVSLDELKNVVDPLNWHHCLPFFCYMQGWPARPDGWSRVLEHCSTTCPIAGTPQLVTPLKYWKSAGVEGQPSEPTACVDFALDDDPATGEHGDGRMVIDEGFIRMTATEGDSASPGVRVRTRKVAGFRDLGWVPAAIFGCVMGYGDQGVELLLGGVAKRAQAGGKGWTDWEPSAPDQIAGVAAARTSPGTSDDTAQHAVKLAVEMANQCIDDMSGRSAALAAKWATGAMPLEESLTFATDLAARLARDPWRYLERLRADLGGGR
ncbi:hypothetical protein A5631_06965 [Mycolicibacter heraklionensis]|nr:hypothetical protein A5631_06965 [Mycolicibacter heraklionensis]